MSRPPDYYFQQIQRELFSLLWAGKKDEIKRTVLTQAHEKGGLKMVDVYKHDMA